MKHTLTILAISLTLSSARADWVIIEKTLAGDKEQKMTIQIKGAKTRTDMGDTMSVIAGEDGKTQMFIHKSKTVVTLNPESMKAAAAMTNALAGAADAAPPKPKATGEKAKVGQWDTEVYTWEGRNVKGRLYIAKNFPKYEELSKAMEKARKSRPNPMSTMFPDATELPGMIVKSEMTTVGRSTTTELVSAKEEALAESVFTGPEGYHDFKRPVAPGAVKPEK
ncbi:MAG: DUF4412 domain-containing protein [Verrucomicrobiaceae bacterium]